MVEHLSYNQTPSIPLNKPYNAPLDDPLYNPLRGDLTRAHVGFRLVEIRSESACFKTDLTQGFQGLGLGSELADFRRVGLAVVSHILVFFGRMERLQGENGNVF